ncbi:hypothetical protein L0156_07970 [bacterium]|nr:hypothetical protein [bacterium]
MQRSTLVAPVFGSVAGGVGRLISGSLMFLEIATLLIIGAIVIYNSLKLLQLRSKVFNFIDFLNSFGWTLAGIVLLVFWPEALYPMLYPRRSLFLLVILGTFVATLARDQRENSRPSAVLNIAAKSMLIVSVCISIFIAIRYMVMIRSRIEGIDFYSYACIARDLAEGIPDVTPIRHAYFPGVFMFWQIPFALGNGSLEWLQWWYLSLIAANAVAVAAVVIRATRNIYAAVLAALFYINLCSRCEGFEGTTEPLSTLPFFLGLSIWGGRSLLGRAGLLRCLALGAGLGLALLAKQQGGLLSLGAISLLVVYRFQDQAKQVNLRRLFLLPLFAMITFLIGFLLEGSGLEPLWSAFPKIRSYGSDVGFWDTVAKHVRLSWPLAPLSVFASLVWLACLLVRKYRVMIVQPWCQVLGFTCIAGYASLIPFFSRGYAHYGLLPGPMFIVAVVICFVSVIKFLPATYKTPLAYALLILIAVYPLVRTKTTSRNFYLWPIDSAVVPPQRPAWHRTPAIWSDLMKLRSYVKKGESLLALPPRRFEIHYSLGTHSGITLVGPPWSEIVPLSTVINSTNLNAVIIINPKYRDEEDVSMCSILRCDTAITTLKELNFAPVVDFETMALWRPKSPAAHF